MRLNNVEKGFIKLQLTKSTNSCQRKHKLCVTALGLRKLNDISVVKDSPSVRGLVNKVSYLVKVVG